MKQWEYRYIEFFPEIYNNGNRSGKKHTIVEDGKKTIILNGEFRRTKVTEHGPGNNNEVFVELPEFIDYLNQLGREGWEVIGDIGGHRAHSFLVKRLVEE